MLSLIKPFLRQVQQILSQGILALAVATLAALVGIAGLGFLAAAGYLGLREVLPPAAAAAASGAVLLLVTLILLLTARSVMRPPPPPRVVEEPTQPPPANEFEALFRLAEQAAPQARRHVPLMAGATFAAGFVLGLKPEARRALWRMVTKQRQ